MDSDFFNGDLKAIVRHLDMGVIYEMELTTKSASIPATVSDVLVCACTRIPCAFGLRLIGSLQ